MNTIGLLLVVIAVLALCLVLVFFSAVRIIGQQSKRYRDLQVRFEAMRHPRGGLRQ